MKGNIRGTKRGDLLLKVMVGLLNFVKMQRKNWVAKRESIKILWMEK